VGERSVIGNRPFTPRSEPQPNIDTVKLPLSILWALVGYFVWATALNTVATDLVAALSR
jgi:hypothetical protein